MAILEIPTDPKGESAFEQRTALDGQDYIFRFWHNQREDRWYMDLFDAERSPIATGRKLVSNTNLIDCISDDRVPPGVIVAFDRHSYGDAPRPAITAGLLDLGERVLLLYFDADEIGA